MPASQRSYRRPCAGGSGCRRPSASSWPPRFWGARARRADDILPTLTSFTVPATSAGVAYGDAHITVTMSVSDPDATAPPATASARV